MTTKTDFSRHENTQAGIFTLGNVEMFCSYGVVIGFRSYGPRGGVRLANPRYRGYSTTTSKHFRQLGCKDFADATTEEAFNAELQASCGEAFQ